MKEIIKVLGMSCEHCENTINVEVGEMPGVKNVKADLNSETVTVEFDESVQKLSNIKNLINELNYKAE